jgi:hypothetical protein
LQLSRKRARNPEILRSTPKKGRWRWAESESLLAVAIFLVALAARDHANDDLDDYKFRIDRSWWSSVTVGQTQSWGDPVLGARFRPNLNKGSFVSLKGDAGGFGAGSQLTWQVYTGVGKQSKDIYSLLLGYRYTDVDYRNAGFLYDTHMSGLLMGFVIRVK